MTFVWLIVQLLFWVGILVTLCAGLAVVVLAPPIVAARFVYRKLTAS